MKNKLVLVLVAATLAVAVATAQGPGQGVGPGEGIHTPGTGLTDTELKEEGQFTGQGLSEATTTSEVEPHVVRADEFMKGLIENNFYLMPMSDLINATIEEDENLVILDVRPESDYAEGHIPGSINIPDPQLVERIAEVPTDKKIAVVCTIDTNSAFGVSVLRIFGGLDAWIVQGGVPEWANQGGTLIS